MRRFASGFLAAVDALAIVLIGVAVALIPAAVIWGAQYGFAADFSAFWRFSANVWLLGHGADVTVQLDPLLGGQLGLAGGGSPVRITIALLGFALLTVQLSLRAGRRAALADSPLTSWLSAVSVTAVLSAILVFTAASPAALPSRPQGILFPTLIVAVAMLIGVVLEQRRQGLDGWLEVLARRLRWNERTDPILRRDLMASLTGGLAVLASLIAVAAIALAGMIAVNYASVVGVYQNLQGGVLGGSILTLGQFVILPNLVIWAASWITGAGFAVGVGSSVSPAGTVLGPVPALPAFGAIPHPGGQWGFVVLLVPILLSFLVAMVLRQRHDRFSSSAKAKVIFGVAAGMAVVVAVLLGLLSWWSGGAIGPGRMQELGPDPLMVALWSGGTVFLGASVGGYAGRLTRSVEFSQAAE